MRRWIETILVWLLKSKLVVTVDDTVGVYPRFVTPLPSLCKICDGHSTVKRQRSGARRGASTSERATTRPAVSADVRGCLARCMVGVDRRLRITVPDLEMHFWRCCCCRANRRLGIFATHMRASTLFRPLNAFAFLCRKWSMPRSSFTTTQERVYSGWAKLNGANAAPFVAVKHVLQNFDNFWHVK